MRGAHAWRGLSHLCHFRATKYRTILPGDQQKGLGSHHGTSVETVLLVIEGEFGRCCQRVEVGRARIRGSWPRTSREPLRAVTQHPGQEEAAAALAPAKSCPDHNGPSAAEAVAPRVEPARLRR